jgi:hypothetical protein
MCCLTAGPACSSTSTLTLIPMNLLAEKACWSLLLYSLDMGVLSKFTDALSNFKESLRVFQQIRHETPH